MAKRRWVPIVLGVLILLAFLVVGLVIVAATWFQQNVEVQTTTLAGADTEFEAVRQKHQGRAPLLELTDGVARYSSGKPPETRSSVKLETLNVLVWDPNDEKLARFTLPFWLVRLKSDPIQFSAYASGMDEGVNIRPEEIEKFGPGIILDTTTSSGDRVLLWTQ